MTTFAIITTILSLAIFAGFVALSIWRFGWRRSYSAYAAKWTEFLYIDDHTHVWSIVTLVVALLLSFGAIEIGDESPWQFLGFFAPVYLIVVSLTPKWETNHKQRMIHYIGTGLCVVCTLLWFILALRLWYYPVISLAVCALAAYLTKTIKKSYVLWLELTLFAAVYAVILIGG